MDYDEMTTFTLVVQVPKYIDWVVETMIEPGYFFWSQDDYRIEVIEVVKHKEKG